MEKWHQAGHALVLHTGVQGGWVGRASGGPGARLTLGWGGGQGLRWAWGQAHPGVGGWILGKLLSDRFPLICDVLCGPWLLLVVAGGCKTIPTRDPNTPYEPGTHVASIVLVF